MKKESGQVHSVWLYFRPYSELLLSSQLHKQIQGHCVLSMCVFWPQSLPPQSTQMLLHGLFIHVDTNKSKRRALGHSSVCILKVRRTGSQNMDWNQDSLKERQTVPVWMRPKMQHTKNTATSEFGVTFLIRHKRRLINAGKNGNNNHFPFLLCSVNL